MSYNLNNAIVDDIKKRMNDLLFELNNPNNLTTAETVKYAERLAEELATLTRSGHLQKKDDKYYII